jgi:hypothetical protein
MVAIVATVAGAMTASATAAARRCVCILKRGSTAVGQADVRACAGPPEA